MIKTPEILKRDFSDSWHSQGCVEGTKPHLVNGGRERGEAKRGTPLFLFPYHHDGFLRALVRADPAPLAEVEIDLKVF